MLPTFNAVVHQELEIEWLSVETGIGALTLAFDGRGYSRACIRPKWLRGSIPFGHCPARRLSRGRGWLGRGLIVVQFALSAVLVVVTITMARQLDFHAHQGLWVSTATGSCWLCQFKGKLDALQIEHLANEINSQTGTYTGRSPVPRPAPGFGGRSPIPIQSGEKVLRAKPFYVSPNFLSVMGIEVLSGQGFDPNRPHGVLLNETAAQLLRL